MPSLEFSLDPADADLLPTFGGIRAARSFSARIVWHDTPDGALAHAGLALSNDAGLWRVAPLRPATASTVPAAPPHRRLDRLGLPSDAVPDLAQVAVLDGRRQALRWSGPEGTAALRLLHGRLNGTKRAACRLTIDADPPTLAAAAAALAGAAALQVPRATLAAEAFTAAIGEAPEPRGLGAPQVQHGLTVSDSLALIVNHLLDVMVHWSSLIPVARTPEPVHQMRVATRRLRSALSIYRDVAPCPDLASLAVPLKLCAARLGTARDWDVFIDGLGAKLAAAFPDDARCRAMMRAATRRRRQAYADLNGFLAGPDFRTLAVALACAATLRPWATAAPPGPLREDTAVFAAVVLARRMKRVRKAGRDLRHIGIPALHELRKDCKRLRYAAEFFASLFPPKRARRYLAALADLQEELGLLNDSAAVSGLMAQLGRHERSYAAGLVEGFSAAHAGPARARIERAWDRFRDVPRFWPG